ncbi:MAG: GLPGLI family protein [Prevotella sp.]|nr:GLPGLI family protein [Prevotella sp.]
MKKIILSLLLALPAGAMAQEADKSVLEVRYRVDYRNNMNDSTLHNDDFALWIGERQSKYFSMRTKRNQEVRDSLQKEGYDSHQMLDALRSGAIPRSGQPYVVMKNWPKEGKMLFLDNVFSDCYGCEDEMYPFDWQLVEGDTVVAGYQCQKAQTTWHGRTWTVWYALDLPYDNGPWKLGGLPGLILSARDAAGDYAMEAQAILKGKGDAIGYANKYEKCTQKDYQSLKRKMAEDPTALLKQRYGNQVKIVSIDSTGKRTEGWIGNTPVFFEIFDKK